VTQDTPVASITGSASGAQRVTCGTGRDVLSIERTDGVLVIVTGDEVSGPVFVSAAKLAAEAGMIKDGEPMLVDLARFTGAVDWGAIHKLRGMDIWGGAARRVALFVRDSAFASLETLIGTLFPRSSLRLFTDRIAALGWAKGLES
jgi:hypothetical protein